jgi:hypothetical protein
VIVVDSLHEAAQGDSLPDGLDGRAEYHWIDLVDTAT